MTTLNQVYDIVEDLSIDERMALYDFLRSKLSTKLEQILIAEYDHVKKQLENGSVKIETVDDMFQRLGL